MNLIPTSTRPATITLYRGVPFDNKYKEHTLISTKFTYQDREVSYNKNNFLDLKIGDSDEYYYPRTTKEGIYNFQYGNGLVTAITLELDENEINSNYMRVSVRGALPTRTINYYYFITGLTQKNETTYLLNLELDIIQTFGEEFLENMKDKPVFTERKHCTRVLPNGRPHCADLSKNEAQFSGVKANHIESVKHLRPQIFDETEMYMKQLNWVYIILKEPSSSASATAINYSYTENKVRYPYIIKCFPLCTTWKIVDSTGTPIHYSGGGLGYDIAYMLRFYCSNENAVKITISPYPPFKSAGNIQETYNDVDDELTWKLLDYTLPTQHLPDEDVEYVIDNITTFRFEYFPSSPNVWADGVTLKVGYGGVIYFDEINLFEGKEPQEPDIEHDNLIRCEPKLLLPPFRKYFLESYSTQGAEFFPQLRFNRNWDIAPDLAWKMYQPKAVVSSADGNFVFTTMQEQINPFEAKSGDGGNLNYLLPTGATAYEHFMNTANAEYTQSKVVSAITNMAKIGAGVGALALSSTGVGAVAGVAGIVSGAIGIGNDITSYVAKMEDLKNTANTFNLSGSSFSRDYAMAEASLRENLYPYVITYITDNVVIEMAENYFYEYGYEVNRDCYFNTQLYRGAVQPLIDSNIFNRTNFNYVKIKDDITMKCVGSNLPLIVAKKFNEILNNGIKLWTFFGNGCIETGENIENGSYNVYRYFQKHTYDNAEFYDQYE